MKSYLRTAEGQKIYDQDKLNGKIKSLWDEEVVFENEHYRICKNRYPYDRICKEHLMLITNSSVIQALIWAADYAEKNDFSYILWNTSKKQTVRDITHIHLLKE